MRLENTLEMEFTLKKPIMVQGKPYTELIIREAIGFDEEAVSQPQFIIS